MQVFLIVSLILAVFALIFALQNAVPATVSFLIWSFESSLAVVLVISLTVGASVILLALLPSLISGRWKTARHSKKLAELESQLAETRKKLEEAQSRPQAPKVERPAEGPSGPPEPPPS